MAEEDLVAVAKVVATHGVRGKVKAVPYGTTLASVSPGRRILVKDESEARAMTVREVKGEGKRLIIGFEGVDTPEEAKRLIVGRELALKRADLPPADTREGEYYVWQLIGLKVQTTKGRPLGDIVDVFETGAHDIYVARDGDDEYLIPAHEEVIKEVDLIGGRMLVEEIEGLFET